MLNESELDTMLDCPATADVPKLVAAVRLLDKMVNYLAQATANGGFGGVRRGPQFWREEAEREARQ
jgi:hypothetical protein